MLIRSLFLIAAVVLHAVAAVAADERVWVRWHDRIAMDDFVYAEYTYISTADEASPQITRFLYEDSAGDLLVIRSSIATSAASELLQAEYSIGHVDSGEELRLDLERAGSWSVAVGGASLTFDDQDPLPASTVEDAGDLLEFHASGPFREALRRLATVGAHHSRLLNGIGEPLRMVFFPDVPSAPVTDYTEPSFGVRKRFDANLTLPNPFDRRFGRAYYE